MKKKIFLLLILMVFSTVFCSTINIEPVDNRGKPGDVLIYNITVVNEGVSPLRVRFYMITALVNSFSPSYNVNVESHESENIVLRLNLPPNAKSGRYVETLFAEIDGVRSSLPVPYTVEAAENYFVFNSMNVPNKVDPRKPFNITLNLTNQYWELSAMAELSVVTETNQEIFSDDYIVKVPIGTSLHNLTVTIDRRIPPIPAFAEVGIKYYNTNFGYKSKSLTIIGYEENETREIVSTTIVSSKNGVVITNNGTVTLPSYEHSMTINPVDAYFIKNASTDYRIVDNKIYFTVPELSPGESVSIFYETNYMVLYFLPLLIIGLIYLFWVFTRNVDITKEVFELKITHTYMVFKIVITVENISNKVLSNLRLVEEVPPVVHKVYDFGTLKGKIKKKDNKRFVTWNIDKLNPKEEVVISYRMKTKIGLLGELELPKTTIQMLDNIGKIRNEYTSNKIIIESLPAEDGEESESKKKSKKKKK